MEWPECVGECSGEPVSLRKISVYDVSSFDNKIEKDDVVGLKKVDTGKERS